MPELPEVETVRRGLIPIVGHTIVRTEEDGRGRVHHLARAEGQQVTGVGRRGKLLLVRLEHGTILAHLGMTGRMLLDPPAPVPHLRALLELESSRGRRRLAFADPRRFGHLRVLPHRDADRFPPLARMGPEPYDLDAEEFRQRLARRTGSIKGALLDQSIIAGVGNIYADEALWGAGVAPDRTANLLTPEELGRLLAELQARMSQAIRAGGTTLRDHRRVDGTSGGHQQHLDAYGRAGEACRRCGATLTRSRVAGRGTVSCPDCQT